MQSTQNSRTKRVIDIQHACCSNGCNLITDEKTIGGMKAIKAKIKFNDQEGIIYLDPEFGSYNHITDLNIPEGQQVDFFCPECGVSLVDKDDLCKTCGSPMLSFEIPKEGVVAACTKKGCFDHALRIESFDEMQIEVDDLFIRMIL
ncbi:MAG: hypothetical protein JXQ65_04875 [Candidatus Marinimicrobia bacterium]|nr:hypothetical protein [Candidatus Neomarinimicrobiota bacterium]